MKNKKRRNPKKVEIFSFLTIFWHIKCVIYIGTNYKIKPYRNVINAREPSNFVITWISKLLNTNIQFIFIASNRKHTSCVHRHTIHSKISTWASSTSYVILCGLWYGSEIFFNFFYLLNYTMAMDPSIHVT